MPPRSEADDDEWEGSVHSDTAAYEDDGVLDEDNTYYDSPELTSADENESLEENPPMTIELEESHRTVVSSSAAEMSSADTHDPQALQVDPPSRRKKERVTTPFLTRYERARVLGTRALQISMNAPILVPLEGEMDPLQIALKELQRKVIPIIIRRHLPDGSHEDWPLSELHVDMERTLDDRYKPPPL